MDVDVDIGPVNARNTNGINHIIDDDVACVVSN